MLCLVADNTREEQTEQIGRVIASRLRATAKARGWTQGQVHYQANQGQPEEIVSMATVSALLRGSINNPGIGTVLAVARAMDLTLDQVVGITPLPETTLVPVEDDLAERVRRLESTLSQFLKAEIQSDESAAQALEEDPDSARPAGANVRPLSSKTRRAR